MEKNINKQVNSEIIASTSNVPLLDTNQMENEGTFASNNTT